MTFEDTPLQEVWSHLEAMKDLPGKVKAEPGFNELDIAFNRCGKMPHEWYATPRWSRVISVAVADIRGKLDYLSVRKE